MTAAKAEMCTLAAKVAAKQAAVEVSRAFENAMRGAISLFGASKVAKTALQAALQVDARRLTRVVIMMITPTMLASFMTTIAQVAIQQAKRIQLAITDDLRRATASLVQVTEAIVDVQAKIRDAHSEMDALREQVRLR